jgi:hypothetical protein
VAAFIRRRTYSWDVFVLQGKANHREWPSETFAFMLKSNHY